MLLLVSLADYGIGTVYNITPEKVSEGLIGWNWTVINANMWPEYQYNENFYTVLAVFFPMVTGIFAGSGMSGDLKGEHLKRLILNRLDQSFLPETNLDSIQIQARPFRREPWQRSSPHRFPTC